METNFITLGDAADRLNVPAPTLRGWCDKLEELKVHLLERNSRDDRIFYDIDLEIMKFIKEQKDLWGRKTTTTDLAKMVGEKFECRKVVYSHAGLKGKQNSDVDFEKVLENPSFYEFVQTIIERTMDKVSKQHAEELRKAFEQIAITNNRFDQVIKQLPETRQTSENDDRKQKLSDMMLLRKIETQLQEEALTIWSQQPEKDRLIKTGLFRKEENREKRDQFVREYINSKFELKLSEELDKK